MLRTAIVFATMACLSTGARSESAWIKYCEDAQPVARQADAGEARVPQACSTHADGLDARTGEIKISATIREVEGTDTKILWVKVPLGITLAQGLRLGIYTPEIWEKTAKTGTVNPDELYQLKMKFRRCDAKLCMAQVNVSDETIERLKSGAGFTVFGKADGQDVSYFMPLFGFKEVYEVPTEQARTKDQFIKLRAQVLQAVRKMALENVGGHR